MSYKINKGDRVRFVGDYDHYVESTLEKGEEYAVTYVDSVGNCDLLVPCTAYSISGEDLELVEPYDRKTAFLRELQALFRKHDVSLIAHKTDMPISVYFNDNEDDIPSATIGKEINKGCGVIITADNIMDFDKE